MKNAKRCSIANILFNSKQVLADRFVEPVWMDLIANV